MDITAKKELLTPNQYIAEKYQVDLMGKPPFKIIGSRHSQLITLMYELGYRKGAEIGVARGEYSEQLCKGMPGLRLYCVDAWMHYAGYRDTVSQSRFEAMYEETIARLWAYNARILRCFSDEATQFFPDGSLDFVYIDAAHDFFHVTQDIYLWERKVRKGGMVAGHDWKRDKGRDWQCHVKDVVSAWAYSHNINPWYVMLSDSSPSWFWIK